MLTIRSTVAAVNCSICASSGQPPSLEAPAPLSKQSRIKLAQLADGAEGAASASASHRLP